MVHLLAEPPEAADMRKTLGNNLWSGGKGSISLKETKILYHDKTNEEADEDISQMLAERAIFDPVFALEMGIDAAERLGAEKAKELLLSRKTGEAGGGGGVPGTPGATGAGSVTRLQRGMPGMEQAAFPQEEETGQVPIE